jgi:hypothetical protein
MDAACHTFVSFMQDGTLDKLRKLELMTPEVGAG